MSSVNNYLTDPAEEAEKARNTALFSGVFGLFIAGIIAGPIAIFQARKAERLGRSARAGKILGWISTILGVVQLIVLIFRLTGM
ncbi:hypothetical protein E2F48_15075 [Arthrobacter crusticola]|uniref:DUF4190 domain-containing protein n=1 Tax=Arthrobacter crusticola TaxID=2547960 RepID=A0A4R5TS24_9MICC|nr:hypothetical protein [Arthrobacter crusticola]TDK24097.1 hypothetical protein E2F48_15075 [Arthrobacter crusticola]